MDGLAPTNGWFIAIAASAGGIKALGELVPSLPASLVAAVAIVQHRVPAQETHLESLLSRRANLPVAMGTNGQPIEAGHIYIAPSYAHLTVTSDRCFSYFSGYRVLGLASAANPLFESASSVFGSRTIAVVLTGNGSDGSAGVREVNRCGGTVIAQDEATAEYFGMPSAAIETGVVNYVLPLSEIGPALVSILSGEFVAPVGT